MKKIIISIATIAIMLFSNCNDFLIENPRLGQSDVLILDTYVGLDKATAGVYAYISDQFWYGADYVLDAEMRSGNGKRHMEYESGRAMVPYSWNYNPDGTAPFWGIGYAAIAASNKIMENLEGKDIGDITAQDLDNLKAECLFIRALAHFDLVRLYAQSYTSPTNYGVPYMKSTDPSLLPSRNTVQEVFASIVEDLLEAEKIIDPDYERAGVTDTKSVVSLPVIQALLSRAYLYMGKWKECAEYATKVINDNSFSMWKAEELEDVWMEDVPTSGEVIFQMIGASGNSFDAFWEGSPWMTDFEGYGDIGASIDLVNIYGDDDVRKKLFKSPDDQLFWTTKYNGKNKRMPDVNNTIILRLSEMYLNRAEANMEAGTMIGDTPANDLNVIISNRNAEELSSVGMGDIYMERRKELAFEGHLVFDLSRTGRPLERGDDYTGDPANKNIPYPNYKWALPISKAEMDVNPNLKPQNPGYGD